MYLVAARDEHRAHEGPVVDARADELLHSRDVLGESSAGASQRQSAARRTNFATTRLGVRMTTPDVLELARPVGIHTAVYAGWHKARAVDPGALLEIRGVEVVRSGDRGYQGPVRPVRLLTEAAG